MASSDTLHYAVARAIGRQLPELTDENGLNLNRVADVAIGVVLAAVTEQIEAVPYWQPGICGQQVEAYRVDVLAVVARLGEDAP